MDSEQLISCGTCKFIDLKDFPYKNKTTTKLSIININIRGLNSNLLALKSFLSQLNYRIDIIVITESHLDHNSAQLIQLDGYKRIYLNRNSYGGGLFVLVNSNITFEINDKMTQIFDTHECLTFDVKIPKYNKISFVCIYRPPERNFRKFFEFFKSKERYLKSGNVVLVGDVNICPVRDQNKAGFTDFQILMTSTNFEQLIKFPTYMSNQGNKSLLDHVWCNLGVQSESYVLDVKLADHLPSVTFFDVESNINEVSTRFRNFSNRNKDICLRNISIELRNLVNELSNFTDPTKRFEIIERFLKVMCDRYFPIKKKKISCKRYKAPWLNSRLIKLINKKHKLFKEFKSRKLSLDQFRLYCRGLKRLLFKVEARYHRNRLYKTKSNPKKKWAYINKMMGRTKFEILKPPLLLIIRKLMTHPKSLILPLITIKKYLMKFNVLSLMPSMTTAEQSL